MAQESPSQNRPATPHQAPDPAVHYDRSKPEKEAGAGRVDNPVEAAIPADHHANLDQTVDNAHPGTRQLNAHDDPGGTGGSGQPLNQIDLSKPATAKQPDHSMFEEEADGWDQAPTDVSDPRQQRHPRTGGKGGTPEAGEPDSRG
jgi:hypothetical protein